MNKFQPIPVAARPGICPSSGMATSVQFSLASATYPLNCDTETLLPLERNSSSINSIYCPRSQITVLSFSKREKFKWSKLLSVTKTSSGSIDSTWSLKKHQTLKRPAQPLHT